MMILTLLPSLLSPSLLRISLLSLKPLSLRPLILMIFLAVWSLIAFLTVATISYISSTLLFLLVYFLLPWSTPLLFLFSKHLMQPPLITFVLSLLLPSYLRCSRNFASLSFRGFSPPLMLFQSFSLVFDVVIALLHSCCICRIPYCVALILGVYRPSSP